MKLTYRSAIILALFERKMVVVHSSRQDADGSLNLLPKTILLRSFPLNRHFHWVPVEKVKKELQVNSTAEWSSFFVTFPSPPTRYGLCSDAISIHRNFILESQTINRYFFFNVFPLFQKKKNKWTCENIDCLIWNWAWQTKENWSRKTKPESYLTTVFIKLTRNSTTNLPESD